ncbi:MAG: type IV toxin-antitoxin system AbiEi family antitoxin domain-containing protein [Solirubrobacterales bacterium]|nr:type IV toxin-antitoxin system AbiEi family antitoxin domain-containing protein [Solirubrobacterales bacterium]
MPTPSETAETRNCSVFLRSQAVDHGIARLAERRHGVVTHAQLLALGLDQDAIAYRITVGRLHRLHRGVYAVGHPGLTPTGELRAGIDAIGEDAGLAGTSALALWDIRPRGDGEPIHIAVPRKVRSRPGIRVLSLADLSTSEVVVRRGIPTLLPAYALLTAAAVLRRGELRRAVNQALVLKRVSVPSLVEVLASKPHQRGRGRLAVALRDAAPTRSELEDAAVAFLRAFGLPPFATNVKVGRDEVDVLWRDEGVVLELDSVAFHDNPLQRAADRAKTARLEAAGLAVIRLRWRDVTERQQASAELLRDRLRRSTE